VLLVDDDSNVLSMLSETIAAMGHKVVSAHDGRDALRCLLKYRSIDCLFTDIVMPGGITGLQLVTAARAMRASLPALLTSAYPRQELDALGELPEGVAFIAKPYMITELQMQLEMLTDVYTHLNWGSRRRRNKLPPLRQGARVKAMRHDRPRGHAT